MQEVVAAVNRHHLLVFVAANLLTGLVNLSMHTRDVSHTITIVVLGAYMTCVCGIAVLVEKLQVRAK